jgi:hypothetical protein
MALDYSASTLNLIKDHITRSCCLLRTCLLSILRSLSLQFSQFSAGPYDDAFSRVNCRCSFLVSTGQSGGFHDDGVLRCVLNPPFHYDHLKILNSSILLFFKLI